MIVQAEGLSHSVSGVASKTSKIVSATGTAYVKRGKLKAVIRFIRKTIVKVKSTLINVRDRVLVKRLNTKTGIPSSVAPPFLKASK